MESPDKFHGKNNARSNRRHGCERVAIFRHFIQKKASYIKDFALKVPSGAFDINAVWQMPDEEAVAALSGLKGVGVWTAEMILLFCMQRPNVFSFGDLAILRGGGCEWFTAIRQSTGNFLKSTANDFPLTAVRQACISGRLPAARFPNSKIALRQNAKHSRPRLTVKGMEKAGGSIATRRNRRLGGFPAPAGSVR